MKTRSAFAAAAARRLVLVEVGGSFSGEVEVVRYFGEADCDALEARRRDTKALKKPG